MKLEDQIGHWPIKIWPHVTPSSFLLRTFFFFLPTRFFFPSACVLPREPEAAPSVAFICTSRSPLLLPLLHLRAAAAAAAEGRSFRQSAGQLELVGVHLFPVNSSGGNHLFKLESSVIPLKFLLFFI